MYETERGSVKDGSDQIYSKGKNCSGNKRIEVF